MQLSPELAEAFPGLMAIALAAGGWFLALYIKRHAHDGSKSGGSAGD